MKDKIFYGICFGFLIGVFFESILRVNIAFILFLSVIGIALILFEIIISKNKWGILAGVFIMALSLGMIRFNLSDKKIELPVDNWSGKTVTAGTSGSFSGRIVTEPEIREKNQKLTVRLEKEKIKILLTAGLEEEYQYGDIINFYGKLKLPENFITDQGKEFDYVNYLKKEGIFYEIFYPKIEIISRGEGNGLRTLLFSVKNKFLEKINSSISSPENLLLGGLILGERASFKEEQKENFITTGTIHIIALSGYNITIVAEWIMKIFSFLPFQFGIWIGIISIFLFIFLTGASSTAIRAGIMATLALIARATGRNYDIFRALLLAGLVMVLVNPFVLYYDISFQLSFIATIAVIFMTPKIEKYFYWITPRFGLRDIVAVTFAAYIFVLPFILYKMGNLSLVALPANVFILPFIPLTMLLGFLTGIASLIWFGFGIPIGFVTSLLLKYEFSVINFFAGFPFASLVVPNFPLLLTLAIYGALIYWLFGKNFRKFFIFREETVLS